MSKRLPLKYSLFSSDFSETKMFSICFREKKAQISSLIKIRPVGAKFFHTDRQTDMEISRFSQFCERA